MQLMFNSTIRILILEQFSFEKTIVILVRKWIISDSSKNTITDKLSTHKSYV